MNVRHVILRETDKSIKIEQKKIKIYCTIINFDVIWLYAYDEYAVKQSIKGRN